MPTSFASNKKLLVYLAAALLGCGGSEAVVSEQDESLGSTEQGLVTAGATAFADIAFADKKPSAFFHVATSGSDSNPGTQSKPWRTVAKAVAALQPGQAAYIHAGVYKEHVTIASRHGTPEAPIFLLGAPGEAKPILRATRDNTILGVQRAYWIIDGLAFEGAGFRAAGVRFSGAHHSALRNSELSGGSGGAAMSVSSGSSDILIEKNKIHDYRWFVNGARKDSHAISIVPDAERILVRRNEAWNNTGDGIQCAGIPEGNPGTFNPRDIVIEDNRFHHNDENAVDIKTCTRVTIRGGAADGSKFFGYRHQADNGSNCGGAAVVIHLSASKILLERTRIWDSGMGVAIGRTDTTVTDVVIRNNVFFNLTTAQNGCGAGVMMQQVKNVDIYNNTFDNVPGFVLKPGAGAWAGKSSSNVRFWNNIVRNSGTVVDANLTYSPGLYSDRNLLFNSSGQPTFKAGGTLTLAQWRSKTQLDATTKLADPLFVDEPLMNDYFTKPGSPARDAALPVSGASYCGKGLDLGFLESCD